MTTEAAHELVVDRDTGRCERCKGYGHLFIPGPRNSPCILCKGTGKGKLKSVARCES